NAARGAAEVRVRPVARRVVLDTLPSLQCLANSRVVTTNQVRPRPVPSGRLLLGSPDDVGEQNGSQNGCRCIGWSLAADEGFDGIDDLFAVPVRQRIRI